MRAREVLDRLERVEPRVGERGDLAPLLDRRAVDLLDLAHEQRDEILVGKQDRELVDRDVLAALEHVDADDVAADRTDAGRDETERTRVGPEARRARRDWARRAGYDAALRESSTQHCVHRPFSYTRRVERLGILGGTFDPVHVAHLAAAAAARDQLELARVLVVVAGDPWQKRVGCARRRGPVRDGRGRDRRGEGTRGLAARDRSRGPDVHDRHRRGAARRSADRELFLIVGSDVAASVETWHRADDLRAAVTLAIVDREDVAPSTPPPGWRCVRVHMPRLDVSSTDLRRRIAAGESVDFLVPPPAARVLRTRSLHWKVMARARDDPRAASPARAVAHAWPSPRWRRRSGLARRTLRYASPWEGSPEHSSSPDIDTKPFDAAKDSVTEAERTTSTERARIAARAADDKKGEDIVVLDVAEIMGIVDAFVIAHASNTRLVRTIVEEVKKQLLDHAGVKPRSVEGLDDMTWVLLDYGDLIVHVFLDETREFYGLERLWTDAPRIVWNGAPAV